MSAICSSLSSASPAHTPKEEYAITQTASAPKEETLHDQPEEQGERRDDRSGMTEGKSLTGRAAARHLSLSMKGCVEKESPPHLLSCPPSLSPFRGGASLRTVSLSWARGAGGGEVLGGASGAAGERDARGPADGVSPAGKHQDQQGRIWPQNTSLQIQKSK